MWPGCNTRAPFVIGKIYLNYKTLILSQLYLEEASHHGRCTESHAVDDFAVIAHLSIWLIKKEKRKQAAPNLFYKLWPAQKKTEFQAFTMAKSRTKNSGFKPKKIKNHLQ